MLCIKEEKKHNFLACFFSEEKNVTNEKMKRIEMNKWIQLIGNKNGYEMENKERQRMN